MGNIVSLGVDRYIHEIKTNKKCVRVRAFMQLKRYMKCDSLRLIKTNKKCVCGNQNLGSLQ